MSQNYQVELGYTVTGTLSYGGSALGPSYVEMTPNCGNNSATNGTNISTTGAYTIRGVPPGTYTINAWRDNLGYGEPNASNATGSTSSVAITLQSLRPGCRAQRSFNRFAQRTDAQLQRGGRVQYGVLLMFNSITNNNNVETPNGYTVQWSASNNTNSDGSLASPAGQTTFPATGDNNANLWFLNSANVSGLTGSGPYYFVVQASAGASTSNYSQVAGPVTLQDSSSGNQISGQVAWTGAANGPLYVGFFNTNTGQAYVTQVGSSPPRPPAPRVTQSMCPLTAATTSSQSSTTTATVSSTPATSKMSMAIRPRSRQRSHERFPVSRSDPAHRQCDRRCPDGIHPEH